VDSVVEVGVEVEIGDRLRVFRVTVPVPLTGGGGAAQCDVEVLEVGPEGRIRWCCSVEDAGRDCYVAGERQPRKAGAGEGM
jgi:hypothetical protein